MERIWHRRIGMFHHQTTATLSIYRCVRTGQLNLWVVALLLAVPCRAQVNLVPNPSFEERDTCVAWNTWYYPETGPLGWFSASGTVDYYMSCLPPGEYTSVPQSYWAFQYPQDGDAYIGMLTYYEVDEGREYFAIELTEPMVVGDTYYASMYATASWNGSEQPSQVWMASSNVGMLFTQYAVQWEFDDPFPPVGMPENFAHVWYPEVLADTVNWVLVSGAFVASEPFRYVIIGNHFNNANTDTLHFPNTFPQYARAHTLIDNVCVSRSPDGCPMASGVVGGQGMQLVLYPNPAADQVYLQGAPPGSEIDVYDASGRVVHRRVGQGMREEWDVRAWARGFYALRVRSIAGTRSFKFVLAE